MRGPAHEEKATEAKDSEAKPAQQPEQAEQPIDVMVVDRSVNHLVGRLKNQAAEERVLQALAALCGESAKGATARDEVLRQLVRAGIEDALRQRYIATKQEPSEQFVQLARSLGLDPRLWWSRD